MKDHRELWTMGHAPPAVQLLLGWFWYPFLMAVYLVLGTVGLVAWAGVGWWMKTFSSREREWQTIRTSSRPSPRRRHRGR